MHCPPAFVLTNGGYYGTLAAARCLGSRGVPVIAADEQRFAPALWSRHVTRREHSPRVRASDEFIDWMLDLGARDPGHVLYATCDDLAWVFAERASDLSRDFRLLSPPFSSVVSLLDKRALYASCAEVGIATPRTWFPHGDADLDAVARDARFPLIIKPRTQVAFTTMRKGGVVSSAAELYDAHRAFARANRYDRRVRAQLADVEEPMLQEFWATRHEPIYAISGFVDARHGLFVARATRKLLQWPRRAGIGICFEDAPLDVDLAARIRALCERAGFVGVFEAEFVTGAGAPLLIDFNPRFFGQMGFDVARGLPSPYLVYLAAMGDVEALRGEVERAARWQPPAAPMFYVNGTTLTWTRAVERLVGHRPAALSPALESTSTRKGRVPPVVLDFTADHGDVWPGVIDGVRQISSVLRHPRATYRAASNGE
jgi:predicted ATP-grasp superfamily ATP-dependent carboligase